MQTFIVGLLLAGVSGVTIVAFRYPRGFVKLFPYLLASVTVLFLGFGIWHVAIEYAWSNLLEYMVQDTSREAVNIKAQLRVPYTWVVFCYIGVVAFLFINLKLPPFLGVSDDDDASTSEQNSH
jgi:hypothetical protein